MQKAFGQAERQNGAHRFQHSTEIEVRDYELDQFGVVNNAVYLHYLQHGRHKYLEALEIHVDEIARAGNALAISEISVRFRSPLRALDRVRIESRYRSSTPARVEIEQSLFRLPKLDNEREKVVAEAVAIVVNLTKDYRPKRFPRAMIHAMKTGEPIENMDDDKSL